VREPIWVERIVIDAVHIDQLREHGGLPGVRDENVLESALARPRQKWTYDAGADIATLAAAYGFGLATGHAYRDGNKRIAFLAMAVFLGLNGLEIEAAEAEVVEIMIAVADRRCSEPELADWLRTHITDLRD
jgi:death-on-curing protein